MKKLVLVCGLSVLFLCGSTQATPFDNTPQLKVPDIGGGVGFLDQHKETLIGEKVYREVQNQMPVEQNVWLEDQLFSVFSGILSQTQLGSPVGLVVINDPQINAFAVPGGMFALNMGLLTNARNMDEVAGVMSHEIAHVAQRHYSRSQEAFKGQGLLALAGILAGALVASTTDSNAGAAVMLGSQAALMDKQLSYSRNQEREADRIGMQYMYAAGYNPQSMADFFEVMNRSTARLSFLPDFWLTHPLTTERMSEARLRANQFPKVDVKIKDENFEILKKYALVLSNQTTEQELLISANQNNFAGQLALAAFYTRHGDYAAAQKMLDQAYKHGKNHNLLVILQTDVYLGQNKVDAAYNAVQGASRIMPENRALAYKLAEVLIRQNRTAEAQQITNQFLKQNPRDVNGWHLMQQAANIDTASPLRTVNVLRYRAEVEYWSGKEDKAIKTLLHAERLAKNNQSLSATLKTRIDQMQKERQLKI